ncbi:MAG: histidinol dehydrogenase [Deltaproteobacteria bacterium]|nr:histidinol dehydrogenase [Deltaproteobacteria bacterium]HCH61358.1 histidinol dehydrogenase [Deltaproteobacteria bacterium]
MTWLRTITLADLENTRVDPVEPSAAETATEILAHIRGTGWAAVREYSERFGDLQAGQAAVYDRAALEAALDEITPEQRGILERTAERITTFARAQRSAIRDIEQPIPGGRAGLRYAPVQRAGCYAPGGRFPLPSSVLMTACTARAAGVEEVWVASPKPGPITLAAAAIAGADALLAVGGAQAIGALAYGAGDVPEVDAIVGPGNRYVTAAKQQVAGRVAIDMLAGPSELLVWADDSASPDRVAVDLLAQAEHDPDARPLLVLSDGADPAQFEAALERALTDLPTADIARAALRNGWVCSVDSRADARRACDRIAPEHLALHIRNARAEGARLRDYGALFIGEDAAEVLGDYGAGPNHTLPTGGTARSFGALSVLAFLRAQTWLEVEDPKAARVLVDDAARLARLEGLEAHARAADCRRA